MSEKIFPMRGNIIEHNHKEDDDPERDGNLPIEERLKKAEDWKKEEEDRKKRLEEIKEEQKKPIIPSTEIKELTDEKKIIKLKKLVEYLEDFEKGDIPLIIKGDEFTELDKINDYIMEMIIGNGIEELNNIPNLRDLINYNNKDKFNIEKIVESIENLIKQIKE